MLSKLILSIWSLLTEVLLWGMLLGGLVSGAAVGAQFGGFMMILGAGLGSVVALGVASIVVGAVLILDDIRKNSEILASRS